MFKGLIGEYPYFVRVKNEGALGFTGWIKNAVITIVTLIIAFVVIGYLLSAVSWYGGMKWRDRISSDSIEEAKSRGVLVRELHFKVVGFKDSMTDFHAYIERGFRYGLHSSKETHVVSDSRFPYQFNFTRHPDEDVSVSIVQDNLAKFDSTDEFRGFLQNPVFKDTIQLEMHEDEADSGKILVWY